MVVLGVTLACSRSPQQPEAIEKQAAQPSPGDGSAPDAARIYRLNCERCHRADGQGIAGIAPPIDDNETVAARDPGGLIRSVLYGVRGKTVQGREYPGGMPGFAGVLSDEEVAALTNYVRSRWGPAAPRVTPADVQQERKEE